MRLKRKEAKDRSASSSRSNKSEKEMVHAHGSSSGLEQTGHVLDTEDVNALLDELVGEVEVILERVLGLLGVGEITRVANGGLDDTSGLLGGIDTKLHVLDVVERAGSDATGEERSFSQLERFDNGTKGERKTHSKTRKMSRPFSTARLENS
jgi:hypothetical protein